MALAVVLQVQTMLLRCPQLLCFNAELKMLPVVEWLAAPAPEGLGLEQEEVCVGGAAAAAGGGGAAMPCRRPGERASQPPSLPGSKPPMRSQAGHALVMTRNLRKAAVAALHESCTAVCSHSLPLSMPQLTHAAAPLDLSWAQVRQVVRRFPHVLGLGVKGHLVPHMAYIKSLGVGSEQLPALVIARPQVLGSNIECIVHHLMKVGVEGGGCLRLD